MQSWMKLCAVAAIAAGSTWIAVSPQATPMIAAAPQVVVEKSEPLPEITPLQTIAAPARQSRGARNLFAYIEVPVRPERRVVEEVQPIVAAPSVAANAIDVVAEKPHMQFPYRYIGRFGRDGNPLAAFARDGEIVTVHAGERVGAFRVRTIGRESVEVEADGEVVRVRL